MLERYLRQVELVARVLPHVAVEDCFAIKGGTAINLFEQNLPRLSVDIDLTYLPMNGRDEAIAGINEALGRIATRLRKADIGTCITGSSGLCKLHCDSEEATIKVEPNYTLRGTAFPVRRLLTCSKVTAMTRMETEMQVLSFQELYGGKVCAALDRQHPRDLFDMAQFYKAHSLQEIKDGFLVLALGHNRPLHELLAPIAQDQSATFSQQFAGMADEPFSYDEHKTTLARLAKDVLAILDDADRQKLLDFVSLSDERGAFGIPNFDDLPAIRWKRHNLELLKKSNPARFSLQRDALARLFEGTCGDPAKPL